VQLSRVAATVLLRLPLHGFILLSALIAQDAPPAIPALIAASRTSIQSGDTAGAKASMEQARKQADELPRNSPLRYDVLKQSAGIATAAGEYKEAEEFVNLAINWRETVNGKDDPKVADDLIELAQLSRLEEDYDRALVILQRVLSMRAREKGFESVDVADLLSFMSQIHLAKEDYEACAGTITSALQIREKVQGAEHPALVPDLDRLAAVFATMRSYDRSEQTFRRVLLIREALLGKVDADLLATLDGLGYALFGQKKYEEAEKVYKRLIELWTTTSGGEHPMVAIAYDKLSLLYRDAKREEDGKAAADRANTIRALVLARGLLTEATTQASNSNKPAAESLLRQALDAVKAPQPEFEKLRTSMQTLLKEMRDDATKKKSRTK
jgi:tetratricopeptide (TPR) repeat protein